ncbi:MAG: 4-alpha-glucanotransferase [Vulcanimicrobiaceae bacterium]
MNDGEAVAYLPPALEHGRAWGIGLQLYALRSRHNWGIGDFGDLRAALELARALGADALGINPLHALPGADPEAASPYAPSSRYFLNPLYLELEAVPEFSLDHPRAASLRARVASGTFAEGLAKLRREPRVAYGPVARAKGSALDELWAIFRSRSDARRDAFARFVALGGERLERFALHEALAERFAKAHAIGPAWQAWPAEFRSATSEPVRAWAANHRLRIDRFKYAQWLADEQLCALQALAAPMAIGLYLDLAVGVAASGADVWSEPAAFVLDETLGAPPDPLGPQGQNWGLPAPDPEVLLHEHAGFRALLESNMRHAGALRLDHVMSLERLFRIPLGRGADAGRYVAYPREALLASAAAVSREARCAIVGEDLGTVPEGFRERMRQAQILAYRVLLFEREPDGSFRPPASYPDLALATATTHDLPTLPGWLAGRDLALREQLEELEPAQAASARSSRRVERAALATALHASGALAAPVAAALATESPELGGPFETAVTAAAYDFLSQTPARLVLVQLDDALGEIDPVNLPGTFAAYPNWRRKYRRGLEEFAGDERLRAVCGAVASRIGGGTQR